MAVGTDPIRGWALIPAHEGGLFLLDEFFLASRLRDAVNLAISARRSTEDVPAVARATKIPVEVLERFVAGRNDLAAWAERSKTGGHEVIYRHSFVGMWGAFDAAIENTVVAIIKRDTAAVDAANAAVPALNLPHDPDEKKARGAFQPLRGAANKTGRPFSGLRVLFEWLGVRIEIDDQVLQKLIEAVNVRNVLVHRYGVVDDTTRPMFNWLPADSTRLDVTAELFESYYHAMAAFLGRLVMAIGRSRHVPPG